MIVQSLYFLTLHRIQITDKPSLRDLLNSVKTTKWYRLGQELGISSRDLFSIETYEFEDQPRMVFQKWLKNCEQPTWGEILDALKAIDEKASVYKLEQKFGF